MALLDFLNGTDDQELTGLNEYITPEAKKMALAQALFAAASSMQRPGQSTIGGIAGGLNQGMGVYGGAMDQAMKQQLLRQKFDEAKRKQMFNDKVGQISPTVTETTPAVMGNAEELSQYSPEGLPAEAYGTYEKSPATTKTRDKTTEEYWRDYIKTAGESRNPEGVEKGLSEIAKLREKRLVPIGANGLYDQTTGQTIGGTPKAAKPVNMPNWYDAVGARYFDDYEGNPDARAAWNKKYQQMMSDPTGKGKAEILNLAQEVAQFTASPLYTITGQTSPGNVGVINTRTGKMGESPIPGSGAIVPKEQRPLPEKAEDKLTGALDTLDLLQDMRGVVKDVSMGFPVGAAAWTATKAYMNNDAAQKWRTARNQLKVAAQTIIKGIPSNFDVQTFIDALPDEKLTESENIKRINKSEQLLRNALKTGIQNYEKSNLVIPDYLRERFNRYDPQGGNRQDTSSTTPFDISNAKSQLKYELKRDPTDEEVAAKLTATGKKTVVDQPRKATATDQQRKNAWMLKAAAYNPSMSREQLEAEWAKKQQGGR